MTTSRCNLARVTFGSESLTFEKIREAVVELERPARQMVTVENEQPA